ncbi:SoxR reducing system RseC family protein [Jeongeupia wiesaeckerbachi]|uniref:SoxR reducing system RseC family protein n=1 Tax=Jeongeupia wiesaeckerbachi TaxID=3051218 RepID=UPI003D803D85
MIDTEAQVVRTDASHAWVVIRPHTPCGNCDPQTGCRSVAISRMFGQAQQQYRVNNPLGAKEGEYVKVAVAERTLLQSAFWAYGLPLLAMLLGALIGRFVGTGVPLAEVAGAAIGFCGSFAWLRLTRHRVADQGPVIVSRHGQMPPPRSCASAD